MLYVRARGAATPRVAPHRPGPAPPHAAGMLISSGHSSTSVESAIASLQLGAAEMRRWWRAGAGPGLLGLERWNKTTILLETVRSFTAREKPRQESRAGREAASQAAPPPPPPAVSSPAPSLDTMSGLCSYYCTDPHQIVFGCGMWVPRLGGCILDRQ